MGGGGNRTPAKQTPTFVNNDAAEKAAQTASAAPPPAPVLLINSANQSDPTALENVKKRAAALAAQRGRKFLQIPLSTAGGVGGIAIPT